VEGLASLPLNKYRKVAVDFCSDQVSLPLNKYRKVAVDFCSDQGAMKEQSLSSVTEEQRRAGQKDQDLVCNGFSGNDTGFITVGESSDDIKVKLAPNPMSGISYLFVDKDQKADVDIRIFDQSGRLLQQFKSSNKKVPIKLSKEASGVYIIECKVGNNVIHKKRIKS